MRGVYPMARLSKHLFFGGANRRCREPSWRGRVGFARPPGEQMDEKQVSTDTEKDSQHDEINIYRIDDALIRGSSVQS